MTQDQEQIFDIAVDSIDDLPAMLDRGVVNA